MPIHYILATGFKLFRSLESFPLTFMKTLQDLSNFNVDFVNILYSWVNGFFAGKVSDLYMLAAFVAMLE